jgi:hypothetical protein
MLVPVAKRLEYSKIVLSFLGLVCVAASTTGCGRRVERGKPQASATAAVAPHAPTAAAKVAEKPPPAAEESCGLEHQGQIRDSAERVTRDPKTGRPVTQVGQALERKAKRTTLAALLQKPEEFEGKSVVVEGDVTAMCSHRRGWYAIVDESGKVPLRIVTAPQFLVPADAMGKRARAVGLLETREVSEQAANHLSRDHGLPEARRVITLRATGAEFL